MASDNVRRLVTIRVSREIEIEVDGYEGSSINYLENAAYEEFMETQAGYDESTDSENFEFKLLRAPVIEDD